MDSLWKPARDPKSWCLQSATKTPVLIKSDRRSKGLAWMKMGLIETLGTVERQSVWSSLSQAVTKTGSVLIEMLPHHSSLLVESFAFLVALGWVNSSGALCQSEKLRCTQTCHLLLTCLSLCNTQARAVNLIHAILCDDEGVTLDVSLCNTQARAVNLIPAILCDDEGVTLDVSLCNTQARAVNLIPAVLCDDEGVTQARGC